MTKFPLVAGSDSLKFSALSFFRTVPLNPTESSDDLSAGVIAGIVVVLAVIAVVIAILVFFVQRHYTLQSRVQQSFANYPGISNPSSSSQEGRRGSNQSGASSASPAGSCVGGSYSDLASYHSDVESYPVSSGRHSSNRDSLHSQLSGVDNMAYSVGSKGSVTSINSSVSPSVMYVSTIDVKEGRRPQEDTMSVKERVRILNLNSKHEPNSDNISLPRKISCHSDDGVSTAFSNGVVNGKGQTCNESVPHQKEDELTVTTIGIRDRTCSEITISTIRAQFLRERLGQKMRVKSEDDVNVKSTSANVSVVPFRRARFTVGDQTHKRDSVVTISTVSSKDRSLSDVTISTLSRNSVYVTSNGTHSPNGSGEVNYAFQKDNPVSPETRSRFSSGTLSTVLSADQSSALSEDDDSVFLPNHQDIPASIRSQNNAANCPEAVLAKENGYINPQEVPMTNGFVQSHETAEAIANGKPCNLKRTGSVQSRTSEVSCSRHNHENHRKKILTGNTGVVEPTRPRNASSSSDSSVSSNGCSECDSCPYCRDCASVMSDDVGANNSNGKFVSIISTE